MQQKSRWRIDDCFEFFVEERVRLDMVCYRVGVEVSSDRELLQQSQGNVFHLASWTYTRTSRESVGLGGDLMVSARVGGNDLSKICRKSQTLLRVLLVVWLSEDLPLSESWARTKRAYIVAEAKC